MRVISDRNETLIYFTIGLSHLGLPIFTRRYSTYHFQAFQPAFHRVPPFLPLKPPFSVCHPKHYFRFQPLCLSPSRVRSVSSGGYRGAYPAMAPSVLAIKFLPPSPHQKNDCKGVNRR